MPGPGEVELTPCGSSGRSRGEGCQGGGQGWGDAESGFPRHLSPPNPLPPPRTGRTGIISTQGAFVQPSQLLRGFNCVMHWPHLLPVP